MTSDAPPHGKSSKPSRRTLRLRFRATGGAVQLESIERLDMICPPSVGERPQAGRHGGYWTELHDAEDRVLFHRLLHAPLGDSVEVHSPDGKIRRVSGKPGENIFEVLVPDEPLAKSIVLMGEPLETKKAGSVREAGAKELARFGIPEADTGGETQKNGGVR